MSRVVLTLRAPSPVPVEAPEVRPDAFAGLGEAEISRLPVWHGNRRLALGELFRVEGGRAAEILVRGETGGVKRLGEGMTGGRLVVEGDAGMHTGAGMRGGHLRVEGRVGDWAAAEMAGGVLEVYGDAGAHLGGVYPGSRRGMTGGEVLVRGSAGEQACAWMRRGLVAVAGRAGDHAGAHMIAGTLLALDGFGRRPGAGMRRGSLVSGGEAEPLPTFRYACTYRPDFLPLYLRHLAVAFGLQADARHRDGRWRRFTGDYTELGKGELLVWTP